MMLEIKNLTDAVKMNKLSDFLRVIFRTLWKCYKYISIFVFIAFLASVLVQVTLVTGADLKESYCIAQRFFGGLFFKCRDEFVTGFVRIFNPIYLYPTAAFAGIMFLFWVNLVATISGFFLCALFCCKKIWLYLSGKNNAKNN